MVDEPGSSVRIKGIAVSPGIFVGPAVLHTPKLPPMAARFVPASRVDAQIRLFDRALKEAEVEIQELQGEVAESLDEAHAAIFEPHLMFVRDPTLRAKVAKRIREHKESAQYAVTAVIRELAAQFEQFGNAYIASRSSDVVDVGDRICKRLAAGHRTTARSRPFTRDVVLMAHDLSPSDTAQLDHRRVKAFATEVGGPTSHTAILAKALEIPAVVGLGPILNRIGSGARIIIDGYEGTVTLRPTEAEVRQAKNRRRRHLIRERDFRKLAKLPAETIDGYHVELSANIELPEELDHALEYGADGVGLYRTEFLFLKSFRHPTEEEQFEEYSAVAKKFSPKPVIFRTLDIGADKALATPGRAREANPFLGLRAIRFCLRNIEIFKTQLRALLRASAFGTVRIMFPMISSHAELMDAKRVLDEVRTELREAGVVFDKDVEVGIMIEIPSAALVAEHLAEEVDFFSIGTNDLIQYTLAVDRTNERVASWYDPFHPAVLRLIRQTIAAGHRAGIWVGVCGEMASKPISAMLLVGLGVDELSMGPLDLPRVKFLLRNVRLSEARRVAGEVFGLDTSAEIRKYVDEAYENLRHRRLKEPERGADAKAARETA